MWLLLPYTTSDHCRCCCRDTASDICNARRRHTCTPGLTLWLLACGWSLQEAVSITREALGSNHPDVAVTLSFLGDLYEVQGKFSEALTAYTEALAIRRRLLDPSDEDVQSLEGIVEDLKRKVGKRK